MKQMSLSPPPAASPPNRNVYTVSALNREVRLLLEHGLPVVWLEGELSNFSAPSSGHWYFSLKDREAQIRCAMFRMKNQGLGFTPKAGQHVLVRGRVTMYEARGDYQLIVEHMEEAGVGALKREFERLKAQLSAEGLFAVERKRELPRFPRRIGVITSPTGAAIRDVLHILARRFPPAGVILYPTSVQGAAAVPEILRALAAANARAECDVLIVARGGGSIEDLWAFNEEVVARAIAGCPVPTISAVGHETDVTIADFVADLRAPTPSAAAEMVVTRKDDYCARIDRLAHRVSTAMSSRLHRLESRLRALEARPGYAGAHGRIAMRGRHAADLTHELRRAMRARLAARDRRYRSLRLTLETFDLRRRFGTIRARLAAADGKLAAALAAQRHVRTARLGAAAARLDTLSPLAVLGRGYAVCWNADRTHVVRDAATVKTGDRVRITLDRGELQCDVTETRSDDIDHGDMETRSS
jgi:exodeoxyribonuclease VII large subunit